MMFYHTTSFFIYPFLILCFYHFAVHVQSAVLQKSLSSSSPPSLYKDTDPILQLTGQNFDAHVLDNKSEVGHLVEFYMSWCGHCRKFAPVWVRFAQDTMNWDNVVKIAAINCAPDENKDICSQNGVRGVPHVKYFPAYSVSYQDAVEIPHTTIYEMRHNLIDNLIEDSHTIRSNSWPNFNHLADTNNVEELWSFLPQNDEYKYLALLFEHDNDNYTGAELLLDISHIKGLKARRVKSSNPLTNSLDIVEFPTLVLLARDRKDPLYKSEIRKFLSDKVNSFFGLPVFLSTVLPDASTGPAGPTTTLSPLELRSKFYVSETDLLLALHYALYTEVGSKVDGINGKSLKALLNFVNILQKYFPPLSPSIQETLRAFNVSVPKRLERSEKVIKLFKELYEYLSSNENGTIAADEWKTHFEQLEAKFSNPFPKSEDWQHCRGSDPKYRGYTCGLWMTFHVLTVNAFFEHGFKPNFDPFSILNSFKGYIEHYFSCTVCAKHFVKMTTETYPIEKEVRKSSDVVLYLWKAHNIVNKRLKGDATEDPAMPKRQFPADFLCNNCLDVTGNWLQNSVLHYLTRFYADIRPSPLQAA